MTKIKQKQKKHEDEFWQYCSKHHQQTFSFGVHLAKFKLCVKNVSKKTDSEKHLGQSVHECIGLTMDSITLLFFIISSTQNCALVMLGSPSQLTSTLGDRETSVFA